ncbi:hypothetical protein VU03_01215, partial [Desulfobulbus sp. N3]|nr:hypothetical protein [Desulfobulbus sp. N3]
KKQAVHFANLFQQGVKKKFDIAKARPMMLPMEKFKNDQTLANTLLSLIKKCMSTIKNQGMLPLASSPCFIILFR